MPNIIAIVGRPNVGKSTLFNRLTGRRDAIVDAVAGVTRDRHYGRSEWNGISFSVIDTGGYVHGSDDIFEEEIRKQVNLALDEADAVIFLLDAVEGLTGLDEEIASMLRKNKKPLFVVVNKVDTHSRGADAAEFYRLGFETIYSISSINGSGTGDLLDDIVAGFQATEELPEETIPKITVAGRPNAGKSSLINVLLDEERHIVTPLAGTTRDSVFARFNRFGFDLFLVDTAGLRKKQKVTEDIEFYSVMRAVRAIEHSDVSILMVDATRGFEQQDMSIFRIIERNHKGIVIVVNKWDLVKKETNTHKAFEEIIREKTAPFTDIPIVFTSVTEKQRIHKALETAVQVWKNRSFKVSTSKLNDLMLPIINANQPPSVKGKFPKIKFVQQLPVAYPVFVFYSSHHQWVRDSYKRFLENKLREMFPLTGVPIEVYIREK
jgi:GTPase